MLYYTDTSEFQLGAIIIKNDQPIAYYLRKLDAIQHNYTTVEKNCLAFCKHSKNINQCSMAPKLMYKLTIALLQPLQSYICQFKFVTHHSMAPSITFIIFQALITSLPMQYLMFCKPWRRRVPLTKQWNKAQHFCLKIR